MPPKISIHLAAWNSLENLPALFESLEKQTFKNFVVRVVDNGSSDGLEKWLREKYPSVTLIRNSRNLGFEVAHNQAIKYAISRWGGEDLNHCYVAVINPDVVLIDNCLEKLLNEAEAHPEVGSFAPKVLKMYQDNFSDEVLKEQVCSDVIDNTGLRVDRGRWFHKRGSGELDEGQYDEALEIFGTHSVLAFYRAAALEKVKMKNDEYFDEDFYAYKEDADLAWRLQWAGWTARFVPTAVAYHARGSFVGQSSFFDRWKNQYQKSRFKNFFQIRNHWWVLTKNLSFFEAIIFSPWILSTEFAHFFHALIFEPTNLRAFVQALFGLPKMFKKRRGIFLGHQVSRRQLSHWFFKAFPFRQRHDKL